MAKQLKNPFTPGIGLAPPFRAGHDDAVSRLEDALERICDRDQGDGIVMHGPLGNGKTAILSELCQKARKAKAVTRTLVPDLMNLGEPASAHYIETGHVPRQAGKQGSGLLRVGAGIMRADSSRLSIGGALRSLLKNRPVILAIEDAQELPAEFGLDLFQEVQWLIVEGLPLLLLIVGNPGVHMAIIRTEAGFMGRSTHLEIGRLSSGDDIRNAFAIPAERAGLPMTDDALALLAEDCQRYPLYIQQLGAASWDAAAARRGAARVELRDAQAGVERAGEARREFLRGRREELERQGILAAATAVAKRMLELGSEPRLHDRELGRMLEAMTTESAPTPFFISDALSKDGFIVEDPDLFWEPCIPSLCSYLAESAET